MIIQDNTAAVLRAIDDKITDRLTKAKTIVVNAAKKNAPVLSGDLRNSIEGEVSGHKLSVGSTVSYGDIQEVRQPHLRPALHGSTPELRRIFGT